VSSDLIAVQYGRSVLVTTQLDRVRLRPAGWPAQLGFGRRQRRMTSRGADIVHLLTDRLRAPAGRRQFVRRTRCTVKRTGHLTDGLGWP